jgi:hypothetical protein
MESSYCKNNVDEVILTIVGALAWRSAFYIEFYQNSGIDQRICCLSFYIEERRYVLLYNVVKQQFDLSKDSIRGTILYSLDNTWTTRRVKEVFRLL